MVKIYKQPFAHEGDTIAIPDTSQPDGKMSSTDGWTPDYQLPKTDPNYKPVGRQEMNGVFKEVTEALGQVQVQGSATWAPDGAPYPINAQVYHNGKQWIALRANSVVPSEGEDWSAIVTDKQLSTKADKTIKVIAGTGLIGGGDLTDDRTLSIATSHIPIGVGQTYRDRTLERAKATVYTNSDAKPRLVILSMLAVSSSEDIFIYVDGEKVVEVYNVTGGDGHTHTFIVQAGLTYKIDMSRGSIVKWMELSE